MNVKQFCTQLNEGKHGKDDTKCFPRCLRRYASTGRAVQGKLSVTEAEAIQFSRSLLDQSTPAWQSMYPRGSTSPPI